MFQPKAISLFLIAAFVMPVTAFGQGAAVYTAPKETIDKIRDEGMNKSQVMQTLSYMTDVIGGRLTGSPNMKRANGPALTTWMKAGSPRSPGKPSLRIRLSIRRIIS